MAACNKIIFLIFRFMQTEVLIAHMRVAYQFKLPLTLHIVQMYHHLIDLLTHNRIFLRYFTGIPAIIFHFCNYIPHDVLSTLLAYKNCFFSVNGKIIDDINKEFTFNNSKESIKTANHKNANCADNVGSGNNISANKKLNSRHDNAISLLRTIPIDHLLIESDSPDQLPSNIYSLAKKASNGVCNTTTTKERTSALESKNESIQPTFKTKYFNEPSLVYYTYQCIAGVLDVSLQHLAAQLHNNNLRIWWATKQ
jgi:Tat protein secretion system quality control protein TatD with DNase activity